MTTRTCHTCAKPAFIQWTLTAPRVWVCWFHFHVRMFDVLGIGRDTAVKETS